MILKNSLILAIFSALSLLLAIFRDRLLATVVGIGPVLDVYNAAFRLPDLMYGALLAFMSAGTVVPFLTKENKEGEIVDPRRKVYSLSLFFGAVIGTLALIIAITLPLYAKYIVPGFSPEQVEQFISVTRILLIQPLFIGLTSLISCFAQMRNEFMLYGLAPLGYSFGIIFGILSLYPLYGLHGLIYGVVIGSMISFSVQLLSLRGVHIFELRYHFNYHHIKELIHLALPRTGTNLVTQGRVMFLTGLATTFGTGGLSSYLFAHRILEATLQLVQQSLTTASLPVLSKDYLEGKRKEYRAIMKKYITILGTLGAVISGIIFLFREEIIFLLYGETGFNDLILFFLCGFLLLLPFVMISGYVSIGLYASKDTKTVFVSMLISTITCVLVGVFTKSLGMISLLYAYGSWAITNFLLLSVLYSRKK